ncbi:MAG: hypothetical protein U5R06_13190 [candidate division KSB1 bacterium]|nr:hypothetical protein [candidate division KSB1 bacterium]
MHEYRTPISLIFIGLLLITVIACEKTEGEGSGGVSPSSSEPRILEAFTCADVQDNLPLGIDNQFFVDETIYLWMHWENVQGDHSMRVLWVDPDNDIIEKTQTFTSESGFYTIYFWIDTSSSAPVGQWLAEIYLNGYLIRSYTFWLDA